MPTPSGEPVPETSDSKALPGKAHEALAMMTEALELLDLDGGAGTAGAHLDLAIHRLREWIDRSCAR